MKWPEGTVAEFGALRLIVSDGLVVLQLTNPEDRVVLTAPEAHVLAMMMAAAGTTTEQLADGIRAAVRASRREGATRRDYALSDVETYDGIRKRQRPPSRPAAAKGKR